MSGRRGRRRKQLSDRNEMRGYWKLKEEALDRILYHVCCGELFCDYCHECCKCKTMSSVCLGLFPARGFWSWKHL